MARENQVRILLEAVDRASPVIAKVAGELQRAQAAPGTIFGARGEVLRTAQDLDRVAGSVGKVGAEAERAGGHIHGATGHTQAWSWELFQLAGTASLAFYGILQGVKEVVQESERFVAAFTGLESIATGFGQDADQAKEAAKSLAADGLMTVAEAAQGLKNLLLSGYGLPEAVAIMERFKDTAAFARQGTLEYGQAIVGATEGVKNFIPRLVDNAGVTKNLIDMYKDYARELGKSVDALSEAEKRQAIYNGILAESAPMLGDAAKLGKMFSGEVSEMGTQVNYAKAALGDALKPSLTDVIQLVTKGAVVLKEFTQEHEVLVATVTQAALALTGLVAAFASIRLLIPLVSAGVKMLAGEFVILGRTMQISFGWLGLIATALTGLIYAWNRYRISQRDAGKETEELLSRQAAYLKESHDLQQNAIDETIQKEKELQRVREQAAESERKRIIEGINTLRDALAEARRTYLQERDAQAREALEHQKDLRRQAFEEELAELHRQAEARVNVLRAEVAEIDAAMKQLDATFRREDRTAEQQKLTETLAVTHDVEQAARIMEAYRELELEADRETQRDKLAERREALQAEIDLVEERAKAQEEALQAELARQEEHIDRQLEHVRDYFNRQREEADGYAEWLIENQATTQDEIVGLLEKYAPEYANLGKSFGERYIEGFNPPAIKKVVASVLDDALNAGAKVEAAARKAATAWQETQEAVERTTRSIETLLTRQSQAKELLTSERFYTPHPSPARTPSVNPWVDSVAAGAGAGVTVNGDLNVSLPSIKELGRELLHQFELLGVRSGYVGP